MGLAASQARFLGITLRKANCEFKSTELAQQRLELTNQMTDISQEYSDALNSTKLVWHNEAVCDSFGNPMDFGLSYGLLMMPSAANDFDPYMITTKSGAIVLNSKYAQAAKDADISMSGGVPSAEGRKKFLKSLSESSSESAHDNIITETTYNILEPEGTTDPKVAWYSTAGMGATPKNKSVVDITTLNDLIALDSIGQRGIDWLQIQRGLSGLDISGAMTSYQYEEVINGCVEDLAIAKQYYMNTTGADSTTVTNLVSAAEVFADSVIATPPTSSSVAGYGSAANEETIIGRFALLENKIKSALSTPERSQYIKELEYLKAGFCDDLGLTGSDENKALCYLYWAVYEKQKAEATNASNLITWDTVKIDDMFATRGREIVGGTYQTKNGSADVYINKLTIVDNDTINTNASEFRGMTIADLLSRNIVIMATGNPGETPNPINSVSQAASYIMDYIAEVFGLGHIGTGLNVDADSQLALEMALAMVKKKFLNPANAEKNGEKRSKDSMLNNSAYINAINFNRIGATVNGDYAGVSLSNMVSAFLTYFDNFLRGSESEYIVGRGNTDGKTFFVTDDVGYSYVTNSEDGISNEEKIADFFNELYNNICEHGWRYDDMVQDNEYLESAIKDGRYSLMALHYDGYFYQERYNDVGYMEEVQDTDAIARAEAAFTTKKAEITFKEDTIDIKSKKLDAEITELNTEISSVQNIISKTIEKTFSLFSS